MVTISRTIRDRFGEGRGLGNLGNIYAILRQDKQAILYFEQALIIHREIGDRHGEANELANLANILFLREHYSQALEFYQQAREIYETIGASHLVEKVDTKISDIRNMRANE